MTMVSESTRMDRASFYKVNCPQKDKTQCEMTVEYMEMFGSITPLEALNAFGCFRLPARISDLKKMGYRINKIINPDGKHYAIYSLKEE